jgi:hypothetical protein
MVARDDSVIRGSLIACLIFLVLSLCLNFFLWRHNDTVTAKAKNMEESLNNVKTEVARLDGQATRMKAMLGVGSFTQEEIDQMKENVSDDPDMKTIETQYAQDMSYLGKDVEASQRNYPYLPQYLAKALRNQNQTLADSKAREETVRAEKEAKVADAEALKTAAIAARKKAESEKEKLDRDYKVARDSMNLEKEKVVDSRNKIEKEFNAYKLTARKENSKLSNEKEALKGTIKTQKTELNRLRSDQFETTQGEVRYVARGGNITTINLGSADELRPGVTFGVIDGDETRLRDAKVKATIQVTQIQGPHLAQARVVAFPEIKDPIIPGDKIFSPFWAPGRVVKIALAGNIDIDGDGRPDNEAVKGQIRAAGAIVAAELTASGATSSGKLDATIRFMVIGEESDTGGAANDDTLAAIAAMSKVKTKAKELGLTVIPAWKLQNYLKTLNDTVTTPLGSATRGEDFPPEPYVSGNRLRNTGAEIYNSPAKRMQKGNKVLPP